MTIAENLKEIHNNVQKVYDTGYEKGIKDELNDFWDSYQASGNRTDYYGAFTGGWTIEKFKPKYDINPSLATGMFRRSTMAVDLVELLQSLGIELTFSKVTNADYAFSETKFTRIGVVDCSKSYGVSNLFSNNTNLTTIDEFVVGSAYFSDVFKNCPNLRNITIGNTIKSDGFNVKWSTKLSKESIISIINALSDTTSGLTVTLSKKAVNDAFETTPGAADGSQSEEWDLLIKTKPKWKISLVE